MDKLERKLLKAKRLLRQRRYIRLGECNLCGDCCDNEDCEHFWRISADKGVCAIFGMENRPQKCLLFPEAPQHPFKRCAYFFQDRHDNGKLIYSEEWPGPQGNVIDDSNTGAT